MNSRQTILTAALLLFAGFSADSGAAAVWTLEEALAQAASASPDAGIARERAAAARAMVEQASSANAPRVTLGASYTQTNNPMMAFGSILNQGAFSTALDFNDPGQVDNLSLSGTVGYNLYSGGRARAGIAAARHASAAAEFDRSAALEDLAIEVIRAFHAIAQADEGVVALEAAEAALAESLRVAVLRLEEGQLLKSEVLNLEVQLAQTRDELLSIRHNAALARHQFAFLLGLDAGEPVSIAHAADPAPEPVPPSLTLENRAELQAMRKRVAAAEERVDVARSGRRPTVDAFASYQHDRGWRLDGSGESWMAGVKAEWAIFDGRETSGRIHHAEAELAGARQALRKLELALALQLERARLAQELALNQLQTTATMVSQASESAEISRARFEAGALLSSELIGVESRLAEARMRRAIARTNLAIAAAGVKRTAGISLYPTP